MRLAITIRRHPFAASISWLLLTFLVLFPKGGLKFAGLPITWGYLVFGLTALPLAVVRLLARPLRLSVPMLCAVASLVPFQMLYLYSYRQNGIDNFGYAFATFVGFFVLPPVFFFVYPSFLQWVDYARFVRQFRGCILIAAIFGIFLFFWRPIMGYFIEIPYLTVNAGDFGELELTKHIARGSFLKLISTYNNGNLYGVATLILLPMYMRLEPKLWKRNTLRLALILTLSRTVWLGLILEQGLSVLRLMGEAALTFPRLKLGTAMRRFLIFGATVVLVLSGLLFNARTLDFLFDPTFGGRAGEIQGIRNVTVLPSVGLTGFSEVTYGSALVNYGIAGMFAVVLIFFGPLVILALFPHLLRSPNRRAAAKGLILYALVAAVDGATNLIPVMAFYWFTYMTMLFGLPGEGSAAHALSQGGKQAPGRNSGTPGMQPATLR